MVDVVQLVRASDCGSECRGFEPHRPPKKTLEVFPRSFLLSQSEIVILRNDWSLNGKSVLRIVTLCLRCFSESQ